MLNDINPLVVTTTDLSPYRPYRWKGSNVLLINPLAGAGTDLCPLPIPVSDTTLIVSLYWYRDSAVTSAITVERDG